EASHTTAASPAVTPPSASPPSATPHPGPGTHPPVGPPITPPVFVSPPTNPVSGGNDAFIEAAGALMSQLAHPATAGTVFVEADLDATTTAIQATLNPLLTIQQPLVSQL